MGFSFLIERINWILDFGFKITRKMILTFDLNQSIVSDLKLDFDLKLMTSDFFQHFILLIHCILCKTRSIKQIYPKIDLIDPIFASKLYY